jgi:hypothetical protein
MSPAAAGDARARRALQTVRLVHTVVWAFFAGSIMAIPLAAWRGRFDLFLVLVGIVLVEVLVLALNGMKCPLTAVAARVARYNKEIFGSLYVAGIVLGVALWLR